MAYSLGLTLYNLSKRRETGQVHNRPPRPTGRLIWLHAPTAEIARSMLELARRLITEDGLPVLFTTPDAIAPRDGLILQHPPADTPTEARSFLDHWSPEIILFSEGELRPAMLHEANNRNIPVLMVAARSPYILREREGWYPGLIRSLLATFRHILTIDEASARAFRKAGASISAIKVTGKMEEESAALPHLEAEREALARLLATRPVWLVAGLPEAEETAAITAHQAALRLAHRLLLVIVPENPARAEPLATRIETEEGWTVARRSEEQEPDPETQVYIADNPAEFGLWYRLAPITFMGGSLLGQGCIRDPLEPAALGSAILYGPRLGIFDTTFVRLGAARAARAVNSPADLAEALGDLLSPDRAARLAQAAWTVTSEGAEVTEHIHGLIRQNMDDK